MAVYGDMLLHWTELQRKYKYFSMQPLNTAGYSKREDIKEVIGIYQTITKGELQEQTATIAEVNVPVFWTRERLKTGNYFIEIDDLIYRIKRPANWQQQGNFFAFILESVTNYSEKATPHEDFNYGQDSYE